ASAGEGASPTPQPKSKKDDTPSPTPQVDTAELEQKLAQVLRNWQDDLREALVSRHGETEGLRIAARIGKALPAGYIEDNSTAVAANDVSQLDA
uniref:NAD-glutamate dehydrogenase domain-containing protein n=1 Tax=Enterobacter hormaechei TaxID=158836 RepID=UPI001953A27A